MSFFMLVKCVHSNYDQRDCRYNLFNFSTFLNWGLTTFRPKSIFILLTQNRNFISLGQMDSSEIYLPIDS